MSDSPLHPHSDMPVVPPRPADGVDDTAESPIFIGPVSLWMGFKTFAISVLFDLAGAGLAIVGIMQSGSSLSTPLVVCGIALLVASSLMMAWTILTIRSQRYKITHKLIEREQGLLVKRIDALDLSRVKDVELKQSLVDRMLNVGTIEVFSSDQLNPVMLIEAVPNPRPVYEKLRDAVIAIAQKRGVIPMN